MLTAQIAETLESLEPEIKNSYRSRLMPLSRRYDSDDLYQEVAVHVVATGRCRATDADQARRYLRVTAANTCRNAITHHKAQRRSVRRDAKLTDAVNPAYEAEDTVVTAEAIKSLHSAMEELTVRQREAIRLRYLEGESYKEIGKELRVSNGGARSLVARGIKLLRELMAEGSSYDQ